MKTHSLLLSIFLLLLQPILSSKVVIIGAGASGIAAASILQNTHQVTILEARERIGGRIWTDFSWGYPLELGGAWIHGIIKNPIYTLAKTYKQPTIVFNYENTTFRSNSMSAEDLDGAEESLEEEGEGFLSYLESYRKDESKPDESLDVVLEHYKKKEELSKKEKFFVDNYIATEIEDEFSASIKLLSKYSYDTSLSKAGEDVLLPNGYINLLNPILTNKTTVHLNFTVAKIDQLSSGSQIKIISADGKVITADYLICTLPLGVLKKKKVQFIPELTPRKQKAISKLGMGALNKVFVEFTEVFWEDTNLIRILDEPITGFSYAVNFNKLLGKPALCFLLAGDHYPIQTVSESQLKEDVVKLLTKLYPRKNIQIAKILKTNWAEDEFAYGSYSTYPVGSSVEDVKEFNVPEGKVYFAGEHASWEFSSTTHGAWESGVSAAKKVLAEDKGKGVLAINT